MYEYWRDAIVKDLISLEKSFSFYTLYFAFCWIIINLLHITGIELLNATAIIYTTVVYGVLYTPCLISYLYFRKKRIYYENKNKNV